MHQHAAVVLGLLDERDGALHVLQDVLPAVVEDGDALVREGRRRAALEEVGAAGLGVQAVGETHDKGACACTCPCPCRVRMEVHGGEFWVG